MTPSFPAGLALLSIAIAAAGCTQASANHPPAAAPAHTAEAATAQAPPEEKPAPVANGVVVPETPAGAQFSLWLKAFNSGDRDALLAYHEQHFPYSVASADVASIDREHGLSLGTNGFTEQEVEESTPTALTLLIRERARPQFARVHLEVTPSAPHRVTRFEIGPIPTPPQFLSQDELASRSVDADHLRAALLTSLGMLPVACGAQVEPIPHDGLDEALSAASPPNDPDDPSAVDAARNPPAPRESCQGSPVMVDDVLTDAERIAVRAAAWRDVVQPCASRLLAQS